MRQPPAKHGQAFLWFVLWSCMPGTLLDMYIFIIFFFSIEHLKNGVVNITFTVSKVMLLEYVIVNLQTPQSKKIISELMNCRLTRKKKLFCSKLFTYPNYPAAWPPTYQALQSSTIEKLRDCTHACVLRKGTSLSWSPLQISIKTIIIKVVIYLTMQE